MNLPRSVQAVALRFGLALLATASGASPVAAERPLGAAQLGVIVNDDDPASVDVAAYYAKARGIPERNLVHVRIRTGLTVVPRAEFEALKTQVDAATPPDVQAFALAWTSPYRVECMSITTAFAFGFDAAFCSAQTCATTRSSSLYDYATHRPWDDLHIRPAMALAGGSVESVKRLIDRGIASDGTAPKGTAYLLITSDRARMTRLPQYPQAIEALRNRMKFVVPKQDYIENVSDVMFYFTGTANVQQLETLKFRPGAVADHLTSNGGMLTDSNQMSAVKWLDAGATGSYGTVVEPCSYPAKFPNIATLMRNYLGGDTLIEAYWRSVEWPGEGIFVGEPLAAPYRATARRSGKSAGRH